MSKQPARKLIWEHIRAIRTCMMVTRDDGGLHGRPMRGIARAEQNAIWFFIDSEGQIDNEVQSNPSVCLTFTDSKENVFVSLSGRVSCVRDKDTINDLWDNEEGSYYTSGPDDPRIMLLRFEPNAGEYWAGPSSPIVIAIKFLEARIFGERPSLGTSGRTELP